MTNREILFRAKLVDNGEWVYGNYIEKTDPTKEEPTFWASLIHDKALSAHKVITETVGQFTGLTDKNGNKIFEGDILTSNSQDDIIAGFYNGCFINNNTYITLHTEIKDPISRRISFEITSNIHDNPTT